MVKYLYHASFSGNERSILTRGLLTGCDRIWEYASKDKECIYTEEDPVNAVLWMLKWYAYSILGQSPYSRMSGKVRNGESIENMIWAIPRVEEGITVFQIHGARKRKKRNSYVQDTLVVGDIHPSDITIAFRVEYDIIQELMYEYLQYFLPPYMHEPGILGIYDNYDYIYEYTRNILEDYGIFG